MSNELALKTLENMPLEAAQKALTADNLCINGTYVDEDTGVG